MTEDTQEVAATFERFGRPGYRFLPVRKGPVAWLLLNPWAVALISIAIVGVGALVYGLNGEDLEAPVSCAEVNLFRGCENDSIPFYVDKLLGELPIYIAPILLIIAIEMALFTSFIQKAPALFLDLALAGRLQRKETAGVANRSIGPRDWSYFPSDLERDLRSRWRYITILIFMIIFAVLVVRLVLGRGTFYAIFNSQRPEGVGPLIVWEASILGLLPIFIVPLIGLVFWTLFVVGLYVSRLPQIFRLDIRLTHGDGCGGLMRIGDICIRMALICIVPGVVIGFWGFTNILSDSIDELAQGVIVVAAILVIGAFLTFLWPVWKIHQIMARAKTEFLDEAADRLGPLEDRLRKSLSKSRPDEAEIERLEEQLDKLRLVYPEDLKFLTWPFDSGVLLAFYTSQILPILTVTGGMIDFARQLVGEE